MFFRGRNLGPFRLSIPGIHNVSNSLIAIAIGMGVGIFRSISSGKGLRHSAAWSGASPAEKAGIMVVDDYGHHPTGGAGDDIAAAKRGGPSGGRVVPTPSVQPVTRLGPGILHAFDQADALFMTGDLCCG